MFIKGYPLEAKTALKNLNQSVHISWARLASFCQSGFISDPLIVSKFHNETNDSKGHEDKIYTIVRTGRRSTAATQSQSPAVVKSKTIHCGCSSPNIAIKVKQLNLSECDQELPQLHSADPTYGIVRTIHNTHASERQLK